MHNKCTSISFCRFKRTPAKAPSHATNGMLFRCAVRAVLQATAIFLPIQGNYRAWRTARPLCILVRGGSRMASNLSIDPDLIERALEVSGGRTKKAAVTKALQEFIARRKQKRLLELMGKLEWDQSYDYKSDRSRS